MKRVFYDKEHDIFSIHKGFDKGEKFKTNIDAGDLILDLSNKGKVKGIEILNASEFLRDFDVNKKTLNSITDADFTALTKQTSIVIALSLKSKEKEIPAKIAVPIAA